MTPKEFVAHYPFLYHMAESGTWNSIQRIGLLSTLAILDLVKPDSKLREKLLTQRRPEIFELVHDIHGCFRIRDQKVLNDTLLEKALIDLSIPDWYRLLNSQVFFWPTSERVQGLLNARAYRKRLHTVITVSSEKLIERYVDRMKLSRINSGATVYQATPRGTTTFCCLKDWSSDVGPRSGKLCKKVAEVAINYSVPDIAAFTVRVEERQGDVVHRRIV